VEPRRYLRCLGQPFLLAPNGEPVRFRTKKPLALLIYLAVDAKPHQRERLGELLWPRVSLTEARHSLATALSTLRPRLGPGALETSRDQVRLIPDRIDLDLQRLEAGDVLGSEVTGPLEVAGFLDGFDIPDSLEFTHWKDRQQARFLPMIKDALVILIDRCRRTGDSRQIERLADRMLALDELSEEAIRAKMEARAFAGDRLTALEFYEEWRVKLAEELQAAPSELVEGMAVRLRRRGWERTTLTNIPTVPTDQWRGRPFIGRMAEYRVLYEAWEAVKRGEPGHALVLGDSGVGKTTLVERLTTAAGLEGAAISRVQCYDLEREIPYSTVSSLILGLLERPGVSATSPQALAELSRTVPAVRHRFPTIPIASDSQGESARLRLTEAFHELLTTIAEEHPVILVVDDLHYADDVSLAVLHLVMRRACQQSIMVVLLARPGELSQSPQAAGLRTAAATLGMREIDVLPLGDKESFELLTSLLPPDEACPSATVQRALVRAGAGYPMVIELLVQDWKANGEKSLALSVDAMTEDFGVDKPPEAPYRRILERITRSLDSTTHNVMNLASILGHRLNDFSLYAIVDLSAGQTMSGMAELVNRRVLRDGTHGLEFVNEMVRAAAYVGVPITLRRILHSKIADRLVMEHEGGVENLGLEIAWHCIRAERSPQATPHLLRGAREAIRSGAPYAAERGLSTAFTRLEKPERTEALVLLAEALQEQGRWEDSIAFLDQIEPLQQAARTDLAFILKTKAKRRLGTGSIDAEALTRMLFEIIESSVDVRSRIQASLEIASVLNMNRNQELTACMIQKVSDLLEEGLEADDKARLLLAKSMLLYNVRNFALSSKFIQQALDLKAGTKSADSVVAMLHTGVGVILIAQGDYNGSVTAFLESHQTACRIGSSQIYWQAAANVSLSLVRLGDYEKAIDWANRVLADSTASELYFCLAARRSALLAFAMLGQTEKAEELMRQTRDKVVALRSQGLLQAWMLFSADAYRILGKYSEAEWETAQATTGTNAKLHLQFCAGPFARALARNAISVGNVGIASTRLDDLWAERDQFDAIDQAEIINARCWLCSRESGVSSHQTDQMNKHVNALPLAVREQLLRMGMLDF